MAFVDTVRGWSGSGDITDYQLYLQTFDLVARGDREGLSRDNLELNYSNGYVSREVYLMLLDWKQGGEGALPEPTPTPAPTTPMPTPGAGTGSGPADKEAVPGPFPGIMEGLGGTLPLLILGGVVVWSLSKRGK